MEARTRNRAMLPEIRRPCLRTGGILVQGCSGALTWANRLSDAASRILLPTHFEVFQADGSPYPPRTLLRHPVSRHLRRSGFVDQPEGRGPVVLRRVHAARFAAPVHRRVFPRRAELRGAAGPGQDRQGDLRRRHSGHAARARPALEFLRPQGLRADARGPARQILRRGHVDPAAAGQRRRNPRRRAGSV